MVWASALKDRVFTSTIPDLRRGLRPEKRRQRRIQPRVRPGLHARAVPVRNSVPKHPAFFCEYCGTQVKQNDRVCPHCGKFFSSVKCPSCGFAGDSRIFRDGCPACGYAVAINPLGVSSRARKAKKGKGSKSSNTARGKGDETTDPLPLWVYAVSVILLGALVSLILLWK